MRRPNDAVFSVDMMRARSDRSRLIAPRRMGTRAATILVFSLGYPALAQNLLINPGFEAGALGWQKTDFGGRSIVASPVHTGTRAQQALVSAAFSREVFQEVAVTAGGHTTPPAGCRPAAWAGAAHMSRCSGWMRSAWALM